MFGSAGFGGRAKPGFFQPEHDGNEPKRNNRGRTVAQAKTEGWGKIIARLIQGGHSYSEIADYTLVQIKIFAKYAEELERERRGQMIIDLAVVKSGDSKSIKKSVNELMG